MKFEVTSEMRQYIEEEMARWFSSEIPRPASQILLARRHGALPLVIDMFGTYGITPEGEVLYWDTDTREKWVKPIDDARVARVTIYQGSLEFPGLGALVPARPFEAIDCSSCAGGAYDLSPMICLCGGMGWLLRGES